ncbi:MAG: metalloregulator ArsR/SmtB family transcription factor [Rhizobiales bacterium]|nr:metalloregulator ArsR/SmtB family transcription factor [Hyphomicrobiales bacterium]
MSNTLLALAALAHEGRLEAWRLLISREPHGVEAGKLAQALGLPANTLSAQLAILTRAGLVASERRGRSVVYRAAPGRIAALADELTAMCCEGRPELCRDGSVSTPPSLRPETSMSAPRPFNVLFLCTGNTARSVLAESILRKLGEGRLNAYSAGSQPKGVVNPWALTILREEGFPAEGFRSKSWDEFAGPDAPTMDFVFTVCDSAAGEACPVWPGQPVTAHWGIEDPAAVEGTDIDKRRAFQEAFRFLRNRIAVFASLPLAKLDAASLRREVDDIGAMAGATNPRASRR